VARRNSKPVGYVALRRSSHLLFGRLQTAIITDFIAIDDDADVLRRLAAWAVEVAADLRVWAVSAVTTTVPHRRALLTAGFLSPGTPLAGGLLSRRAPLFMWAPQGPGSALTADAVSLTYSDSDLELNL
jgi:hypothetical protein